MREFINNVKVAGILVKHTLEESTYGDGVECIRGEVIIRTADENEHTVKFFSNRYTKDKDGNFTDTESKIYKSLLTVINEYNTLENCPDDPDYVEITNGSFSINDYKNNKGEISSLMNIQSNFINRISKEKIDTISPKAKFEVEGVIASVSDEIIKNEPTGNLTVVMNVITQKKNGKGKDAKFEVNDMFPIKLTVPTDLVDTFRSIYSEGMFAKFTGTLVNKTETVTKIEKQAMGGDIEKTYTNTIRRFEVETGNTPTTIYDKDIELTDDICATLISKRKAKLAEVMFGKKSNNSGSSSATSASTSNPFASKNPFAK